MNLKKKTKKTIPEPEEMEEETAFDPTANLEEYLRACVRIDPLDIQTEFVRIPGDLAYWNDRYAQALREHLTAEMDLKLLRAQLQPLVRQALADAGGKTTEAQVAAAIEEDEQVTAAKRRQIEAEVEKNRLYGTLDAIRSKKEVLISLGAHLRAEMQGDPALRDQVAHAGRRGSSDSD